MAALRTLPALAAALLLAAAGQASKYSREANEGLAAADGKRRESAEFRVVRLNQIWEKAQRVSGAARGDGGARRGLRGRARPLQPLIPRQGDGEERAPVCEERPRLSGPGSGLRCFCSVLGHGCPRPSRSERCAVPRGGRLCRRRAAALSRDRGCVSEPGQVFACPWLMQQLNRMPRQWEREGSPRGAGYDVRLVPELAG